MKFTISVSGAEVGAVATGSLKGLVKVRKTGQRGCEAWKRVQGGWDQMKGS